MANAHQDAQYEDFDEELMQDQYMAEMMGVVPSDGHMMGGGKGQGQGQGSAKELMRSMLSDTDFYNNFMAEAINDKSIKVGAEKKKGDGKK